MYGVGGKFSLDLKFNGVTYPVGEGRLASLRFHEMSTYMTPMAEIALEDSGNWLVEVMPFTGTEVVDIGLGNGPDDMIYHSFRIYNSHAERSGGSSHRVKLYLVSAQAAGMFQPSRYRSYPNMLASEVVESIVDELELEVDDQGFEPTDAPHDFFCPGWTFAQFIAWLADRSRSKQHGTAGFLYFVDLEGKMHFCSPEYVKVQKPSLTIIPKDPNQEEAYAETDIQQGTHRVYFNPLLMGGQGAYGVNLCYWDFTTGKFVEEPLTVNGETGVTAAAATSGFTSHERNTLAATRLKGLADNVGMLESSLDPDTVIINGGMLDEASSREYARQSAEAKLLRTVNSLSKIEMLIEGDMRVRAGKLVDIRIGSTHPSHMINQTFSGKYIVERVTQQVMPGAWTKLLCFRSGIGGSDEVNLVEPPRRIG